MKDYIHFTGLIKNNSPISNEKAEDMAAENLQGILKNGFRFSTNKVFTPRRNDKSNGCEMQIEMICFSEMHISDIKLSDKHGKFSICMSYDWIKKYNGQPVLYSFGKSTSNFLLNEIEDVMIETFDIYIENNDERLNDISLRLADLTNLVQAVTEPYNHKIENEWRITNYPRNESVKSDLKYNDENNSVYLEFKDEDINYIVIPKSYLLKFEELVETKNLKKEKLLFFEDIN